MFQMKITGIVEAGLFIKNKWPTKIVSIVDPEQQQISLGQHHIILKMHDVETETSNSIVIPEKQHIEQILEFTKFLTDKDKLLVHCNMGVSRSTAVSCGILIQHGMTFEDAYNYVKTIRNVARPNRKIIKYIDDIFALNGKFLNFINEKRNPSNVIPLSEIAKYYANKKHFEFV